MYTDVECNVSSLSVTVTVRHFIFIVSLVFKMDVGINNKSR